MSWIVRSLVVLVLLLALSLPVIAQDVTDEPPAATLSPTLEPTPVIVEPPPPNPIPDDPTEPPVTTPETLLGQLYSLLKDGTYMVWAAAGVLIIVGVIKVLAQGVGWSIGGTTAIVITLIVQVLIWLGYAIANYFNQGDAFKDWYLKIIDVLRALLPLAGSIFLGHVGYKAAHKRNVPVLGYKAPEKPDRPPLVRQ